MIMNKFLLKIGCAALWFFCLFMGIYVLTHYKTMKTNIYAENGVFVWGDSQMFQGLDDSLLGKELGKRILSSAEHGSGIYDFLVCEKCIPNNALCIFAFPEGALLRNPLLDYNRKRLDFSCLKILLKASCPLDNCWQIIKLNLRSVSYPLFSESHSLFSYSDIIVYPEPLSGFCGMFSEKKDYFEWKAKSYEMGLQDLYDKHNQIILIQFPFEQQVENCARNSINRHLTDSLKFELVEKYALKYDSIVLHSDSLLMHDLSHMNEVGARMLTYQIADILRKDTINNRFFTVVIK